MFGRLTEGKDCILRHRHQLVILTNTEYWMESIKKIQNLVNLRKLHEYVVSHAELDETHNNIMTS